MTQESESDHTSVELKRFPFEKTATTTQQKFYMHFKKVAIAFILKSAFLCHRLFRRSGVFPLAATPFRTVIFAGADRQVYSEPDLSEL